FAHQGALLFQVANQRSKRRRAKQPKHNRRGWPAHDMPLMPDKHRVGVEHRDVVVEVEDEYGTLAATEDAHPAGSFRVIRRNPLKCGYSGARATQVPGTGSRRAIEKSPLAAEFRCPIDEGSPAASRGPDRFQDRPQPRHLSIHATQWSLETQAS